MFELCLDLFGNINILFGLCLDYVWIVFWICSVRPRARAGGAGGTGGRARGRARGRRAAARTGGRLLAQGSTGNLIVHSTHSAATRHAILAMSK